MKDKFLCRALRLPKIVTINKRLFLNRTYSLHSQTQIQTAPSMLIVALVLWLTISSCRWSVLMLWLCESRVNLRYLSLEIFDCVKSLFMLSFNSRWNILKRFPILKQYDKLDVFLSISYGRYYYYGCHVSLEADLSMKSKVCPVYALRFEQSVDLRKRLMTKIL